MEFRVRTNPPRALVRPGHERLRKQKGRASWGAACSIPENGAANYASIASSSLMKPSSTERPFCQKDGSVASSPNGASSSE